MKTFFVFSLINGPNNDDNNTGELQIPLPGGYVFAKCVRLFLHKITEKGIHKFGLIFWRSGMCN